MSDIEIIFVVIYVFYILEVSTISVYYKITSIQINTLSDKCSCLH